MAHKAGGNLDAADLRSGHWQLDVEVVRRPHVP